jgi:HEAT repeat protein
MPRNAARCLERIKDTAAVIPLIEHMDHPEYSVRSQVATALGKTGDARALDSLIVHLAYDPDSDVRKSCAVALGLIRREDTDQSLVGELSRWLSEAFEDSFFGVRQSAISSLCSLKLPTTGYFEGLALNTNGIVAYSSEIVLGSCTTTEGREPLIEILDSPDHMKRGFAVEGLAIHADKKTQVAVAALRKHETDPFVLAQIARFEQIVLEKKNEQAKPR